MQTATPSAAATWSSRFSFLLAAVGAAVGLGNIWRFPYLAGANGGAAFVLVYLAAAALVAVPILIGELAIGRRGRRSPPLAMAAVAGESGCSRHWGLVGGLGVLVGYLIVTFYGVIAGWAMAYVWPTLTGRFDGIDAAGSGAYFNALLASPMRLAAWSAAFMAITGFIIARGLHAGIERWISVLMPALFLALVLMIGYAAIEGDFAAGLEFLFQPDFNKITGHAVLDAIGQAFFSIGVSLGIMMVYGAYVPRDVSLTRSAFLIAGADTLVAVLAGVAIFPLVFANGLDPGEGPGLVFVTLPIAFGRLAGGNVFGAVFFVLLVFAALTSSIALIEAAVAWLGERFALQRPAASALSSGSVWLLGLGTVFSFNLWSNVHPLGMFSRFESKTVFDLVDYATSNLMMPAGALLLSLFVGWRMNPAIAEDEAGLGSGVRFMFWRLILMRWVAPLAIAGIMIAGL